MFVIHVYVCMHAVYTLILDVAVNDNRADLHFVSLHTHKSINYTQMHYNQYIILQNSACCTHLHW